MPLNWAVVGGTTSLLLDLLQESEILHLHHDPPPNMAVAVDVGSLVPIFVNQLDSCQT